MPVPTQNMGASPLVLQILEILSQKAPLDRQREEDARRHHSQDLAESLQAVTAAQAAAAQTPVDQAPQLPILNSDVASVAPLAQPGQSVEDMAKAKGIPTTEPQRDIMMTTKDGRQVPLRPFGMKPPPLRYKEEVAADKTKDLTDERVATGQALMVTPEMLQSIEPQYRGFFPVGKAADKSQVIQAMKPGHAYQHFNETDAAGRSKAYIMDEAGNVKPAVPDSGGGGGPDFSLKGEEFFKTLRPEDQTFAQQLLEYKLPLDKVVSMRQGAREYWAKVIATIDPTFDMNTYAQRLAAKQDLAKGSSTGRGMSLTSLNQLARHINETQESSEAMKKAGYGNSDFETANAIKKGVTPKGKQASITGYNIATASVVNEYIKALSGGVPTNEERQAMDDLKNPNLPIQNRNEALDKMRSFAQARANAQEDWYRGIFGKTSTEDKHPIFEPSSGWRWVEGSGWQIPRLGGTPLDNPAAGKPGKPGAAISPGLAKLLEQHNQ